MNRFSALPFFTLLVAVLLAGCGGDSYTENASGADSSAAAGSSARSGLAAYDENGDGIVYQGGMHPDVIQDEPGNCPVCGMKLNPTRVDGGSGGEEGSVIISPATMQNMGVRTTSVEVAALGREIQTTGRFEAPDRGMTIVSPKVGGWVEELYVNSEGQRVREGQRLMEIYSPELVSTQEEYLLALRNAERMQGGGASESSTEGARRLVEAARRRLAYWDISDEQIERLKRTGEPTKTLTLYAPASGTVKQKRVTEGQQIRAGETLMHLSDLNPLWLMLDIYEQDLSAVEVGSPVVVALPYAADGQKTRGRVDYIYDEVDAQSRTIRARVTVSNPGLKIKPGMYAEATIEGERAGPRPVVPTEAVVSGGGEREVVIEALGEGRFRPVPVRTGVASGERVQILSGLEGGERVVTSAQFLIDSEARLQNALGSMTAGSAPDSTSSDVDTGDISGSEWEKATRDRAASAQDVRAADRDGDGFVFQGPMHPEIVRDTPNRCPVCEMNLERVAVEEAVRSFENAQ